MTTTNGQHKTNARVIIVGAGPVGMLIALRLGQAGVDTLVIEGHESLLNTTRAVVYMPVVIPILRELGILERVKKEAFLNADGVTWRDLSGEPLAQLPLSSSNSDEFNGVLLLGQWRMNALILEELKKYPSVEVRFGLKLTSLDDDPSSPVVKLTAHSPKDQDASEIQLTSSYVIGTDGANSATRHLLDITFDGFTYGDFRMIGIDVIYDFTLHENFKPLNFVVHPTDWAVIVYTAQDEDGRPHGTTDKPQWRVAYVEDPSLPDDRDAIWQRADQQMAKYAKSGAPWKLIRAEPYTMSQRCASQPIKGRVALAGDALHSNNPIGGLGLTGGILDAFCYGNALTRVVAGDEPAEVLTRCAESRLAAWKNVTNKLSQANLERLYATDAETVKGRTAMFAALNGLGKEELAGKIRKSWTGMLGDDFSDGVAQYIAAGVGVHANGH